MCWLSLDLPAHAAAPLTACPRTRHVQLGTLPGALNIPISQLRKRLGEVPAGKTIYCYCQVRLTTGLEGACWSSAGAACQD